MVYDFVYCHSPSLPSALFRRAWAMSPLPLAFDTCSLGEKTVLEFLSVFSIVREFVVALLCLG